MATMSRRAKGAMASAGLENPSSGAAMPSSLGAGTSRSRTRAMYALMPAA